MRQFFMRLIASLSVGPDASALLAITPPAAQRSPAFQSHDPATLKAAS